MENILKKLLEVSLPGYNWDRFDVISVDIEPNKDEKTNKIFLETLKIKIEEKDELPQELWDRKDWYAHWFCESKTYEDYNMRGRKVLITERRRRRRNKETHEILLSWVETPIVNWTKSPNDLLDFLKIGW